MASSNSLSQSSNRAPAGDPSSVNWAMPGRPSTSSTAQLVRRAVGPSVPKAADSRTATRSRSSSPEAPNTATVVIEAALRAASAGPPWSRSITVRLSARTMSWGYRSITRWKLDASRRASWLSRAVSTVAERGSPVSRPISPKIWPGPSSANTVRASRGPVTTRTRPLTTR